MANYTQLYTYTTNPAKIRPNDEADLIAKIGKDLTNLITAFNVSDTIATEIETAFETLKVPIPLERFREMTLNGVLGGTIGLQPTGILDMTTDVTLTGDDYDSFLNGITYQTEVLAAAANPTDTVLIAVTKADVGATSAKVTITITPNDGTNNGATPVGLTTAQLVLAINGAVTGAYGGINVTFSGAALAWLTYITASGGDATALANSGEGDSKPALMNGGRLPGNGILGQYTTPMLRSVTGDATDEDLALIWVASNSDTIGAKVSLPDSFSGLANVTLNVRAKSGGDTDTPTISVQSNWDEDDAPITDVTSAVNTDTADWAIETATIALADLTASADHATIWLTPGAHTTDTLIITEVYLTVDRVVTHA